MALHGELKVNSRIIGCWEAVRNPARFNGSDEDPVYVYDCEVTMYDLPDVPVRQKFFVVHRYKDGAVILAAKVLSACNGRFHLD